MELMSDSNLQKPLKNKRKRKSWAEFHINRDVGMKSLIWNKEWIMKTFCRWLGGNEQWETRNIALKFQVEQI